MFWIITATLLVGGLLLIVGSGAAGLGPIALVCGVLMLWSGIIKAIVLRIWHTTFNSDSTPEPARPGLDPTSAVGHQR